MKWSSLAMANTCVCVSFLLACAKCFRSLPFTMIANSYKSCEYLFFFCLFLFQKSLCILKWKCHTHIHSSGMTFELSMKLIYSIFVCEMVYVNNGFCENDFEFETNQTREKRDLGSVHLCTLTGSVFYGILFLDWSTVLRMSVLCERLAQFIYFTSWNFVADALVIAWQWMRQGRYKFCI